MKKKESQYDFIRKALGCNQEQLAYYLGISRSHLAMAERRRRSLSTNATIKLLKLYGPILQTPPAEDPEPAPATTPGIEDYKWVMQNSIMRQQKKLAAITTQRQEALNTLQLVAVLAKASDAGSGPEYADLLKIVESMASYKLYKAGKDSIALEQLKLKALEAAWQAIQEEATPGQPPQPGT